MYQNDTPTPPSQSEPSSGFYVCEELRILPESRFDIGTGRDDEASDHLDWERKREFKVRVPWRPRRREGRRADSK
jgi:hypothetical protein